MDASSAAASALVLVTLAACGVPLCAALGASAPARSGAVRGAWAALALAALGWGLTMGPVGVGVAFSAVAPVATLLLLTAVLPSALLRWKCGSGVAAAVSICTGYALLALPFIADPLVEAHGSGKSTEVARIALVQGWTTGATVGGALGVDVLRAPLVYGTGSGGLSRIGAFYTYTYPSPWKTSMALAAFAIVGAGIGGGLGERGRRLPPAGC